MYDIHIIMHDASIRAKTCTAFPHYFLWFTEVLIPLENETISLRGEGHFFCQLQGNEPRLRIGGCLRSIPHYSHNHYGINITATDVPTPMENPLNITNITIIITALVRYNNTEVECYDQTMGRENASKATLTIQGTINPIAINFVPRLDLCALNTWVPFVPNRQKNISDAKPSQLLNGSALLNLPSYFING